MSGVLKSDTPRKAGGLMSRAASKAVAPVTQTSRRSAPQLLNFQNWPFDPSASSWARMYWRTCSNSKPTVDTAYPRVPPSPKMLPCEIALLAAKLPSHGNGALPFEKTNHRSYRVLRGTRDTHMNMIRKQMPFQNLTFFLLRQRMKNLP